MALRRVSVWETETGVNICIRLLNNKNDDCANIMGGIL